MNERDIAKYATKVALGLIAEDELSAIIGDDNIVQKIMSVAGASVVVGVASGLIDEAVDVSMDIVDTFNPFKW